MFFFMSLIGQRRQHLPDPIPEPRREDLGGRVSQAIDLVEVVVIEPRHQRAHDLVDLAKVNQPARHWIDRPDEGDFKLEGVAVQARAFVSRRDVGQKVGRLEAVFLR